MAPANGWPTPHNRFWIASAKANTSRPQPFARDSGVRKKPSEERGPNVRIAITQPHSTITAGVRHAGRGPGEGGKRSIAGGLRARAAAAWLVAGSCETPQLFTTQWSGE